MKRNLFSKIRSKKDKVVFIHVHALVHACNCIYLHIELGQLVSKFNIISFTSEKHLLWHILPFLMLNQVKEKGYLAMNFLKEISFHNRCACLNKGDLSFSAK